MQISDGTYTSDGTQLFQLPQNPLPCLSLIKTADLSSLAGLAITFVNYSFSIDWSTWNNWFNVRGLESRPQGSFTFKFFFVLEKTNNRNNSIIIKFPELYLFS